MSKEIKKKFLRLWRCNFKREQNRSFESFVHLSNICRKKRKKNVTSWRGQFTSKIRLGISDKIFS